MGLYMLLEVVPDQGWGNRLAASIASDGIMTPLLGMIGEVGQRVVGRPRKQELAVVEACHRHSSPMEESLIYTSYRLLTRKSYKIQRTVYDG